MKKIIFGIAILFLMMGSINVHADTIGSEILCEGKNGTDEPIKIKSNTSLECKLYVGVTSGNVKIPLTKISLSKPYLSGYYGTTLESREATIRFQTNNNFNELSEGNGFTNYSIQEGGEIGYIGSIYLTFGDVSKINFDDLSLTINYKNVATSESTIIGYEPSQTSFSFILEKEKMSEEPVVPIEEINSNDSSLKELTIENYNINFNSNNKVYEITIKDEEKLNINCTPTSEKSKCEIMGNENLKDGSIISIKVTAEDESNSVYTVNIKKASSGITTEYLILGGIGLLIIALIILYVYLETRKSKQVNFN